METYTREEQYQIAMTALRQLGNPGMMKAMIGLSNVMYGETDGKPYLQFDFKGCRKHNKCRIVYNPGLDLYNFELYQYRPKSATCPQTYKAESVYADMLTDIFENETGLYLSL